MGSQINVRPSHPSVYPVTALRLAAESFCGSFYVFLKAYWFFQQGRCTVGTFRLLRSFTLYS